MRPAKPLCHQVHTISIPKWYDYEDRKFSWMCLQNLFQFQNGTIMSLLEIPYYRHLPHFNSKMVRLWATVVQGTVDLVTFQFQNGTIMSFGRGELVNLLKSISIPKWYDYEGICAKCWTEDGHISIPKWYDYETFLFHSDTLSPTYFNSKMVRLWA